MYGAFESNKTNSRYLIDGLHPNEKGNIKSGGFLGEIFKKLYVLGYDLIKTLLPTSIPFSVILLTLKEWLIQINSKKIWIFFESRKYRELQFSFSHIFTMK